MKVLGCIALHYGKEYLEYALDSISDHCNEILILYTSTPSYGHNTLLKCPDTRQELYSIASKFNVTWKDIKLVNSESEHRRMYEHYARANKYDLCLICDSDEVYNPNSLDGLLEYSYQCKSKRIAIAGSQWYHFWKGFDEVNRDAFYPIRVLNINNQEGQEITKEGIIYHFGYAISEELMKYKISCHGHKSDFENNKSWINKWLNYKRGETKNLHPATDAYWIETEDFDKRTLPDFLQLHPKYE